MGIFVFARALIISYLFLNRDKAVKKDTIFFTAIAYLSTFLPLTYVSGNALIEGDVAERILRIIVVVSYSWSVYSLLCLGKSFGISPSKRLLVSTGPYAIVNHPAYWGYVIGETAIIVLNFNLFNVCVLILSASLYLLRAKREDLILKDRT